MIVSISIVDSFYYELLSWCKPAATSGFTKSFAVGMAPLSSLLNMIASSKYISKAPLVLKLATNWGASKNKNIARGTGFSCKKSIKVRSIIFFYYSIKIR
jgi:hypothetical protein